MQGAGEAYVSRNFERYNQMQLAAFAPAPFDGVVSSNATHVMLQWEDACPSVRVLRVTMNGAAAKKDPSRARRGGGATN